MDINNTEETGSWYYIDNGEVTGPFTEEEIHDLYQQNKLEDDTEVWKSGMQDWVSLSSSELFKKDVTEALGKKGETNYAMDWILAVLPALFAGAILMKSLPLGIILLVIHCAVCIMDAWGLIKEGKAKKTILFWSILLPPVYLFKRAGRLYTGNLAAFVWCLFFAAELIAFTRVFDISALPILQKKTEITETEAITEDGTITVDDFVKAYIKNPQYDLKDGEDGASLFYINGTMDYEGKEAPVSLTFEVAADDTVHFKEITVDGNLESTEIYYERMDELKSKID